MKLTRNQGRTHGTVVYVAAILASLFVFFWSYITAADEMSENDQHVRVDAAMHDLRSLRLLRDRGIPIHVTFPDGSASDITLKERSDAISSEESVGFYDLPTSAEILAHWGVGGYSAIGSPSERRLSYVPRYSKLAIEKYFSEYFEDELHPPTPPRFDIENGHVRVTDDAPGQDFDYPAFYTRLDNELSNLERDSLPLDAVSVPSDVRASDLVPRAAFLDRILRGPGILIRYDGYSWPIDMTKLVKKLSLIASSTDATRVGINSADVESLIASESQSLIKSPVVEPRISIKDGGIVIDKKGMSGQDFSYEPLAESITKWLQDEQMRIAQNDNFGPRPSFELTVVKTDPRITLDALARMGINSRIGVARTNFKTSSNDRVHNITLGASRVTGKLVMPGEEYSLVKAIGYAEKENGYREEYVIKGNRSKKEAGGGLCQVATTFFRAMINAGLPVTERHNHRYVVGYYGPGLDATIYDVSVDLKFKNDTGAPVLVQAHTEGRDLVVEFFGKSDGRVAVTSEPVISHKQEAPPTRYLFTSDLPLGDSRCVEHARAGMQTDASTRVTYADGKERVQNWHSEYTPWAQVCLIGAPWGTEPLPK